MSTTLDAASELRPFRVDMPDEAIADLRRRVAATRWPHKELVADRSQGVQLATMQALARYWATEYDWRACEAKLNALPQFKTEIDGVDIHFIHVKSPHAERPAADHDARLARLGDRAARGHRPAHRPDRARRTRRGRVRPRAAIPARLRLLRRAGRGRLGPRPHRARLGGADAPPRLHPLRRAGRRRRRRRHRRDGPPGTRGAGRHPYELARDGAGRPAPRPAETEEERAALEQIAAFRASGWGYFLEQATRPQTIGYALLDSPVALAAWMLDHDTDSLREDLPRLRRRAAVGRSHPGPHPRQHQPVLADGHRGLGGSVLLGERTSPGSRGRPGSAAGHAPGRLHHVPRRDLPGTAQLGREGLPQPHLLPRGRQGRPLRRLGRARAVRDRDPAAFRPLRDGSGAN